MMQQREFIEKSKEVLRGIEDLDFKDKVEAINQIREFIHEMSPFKSEPIDFVKWVNQSNIVANDYNPNSVAPTEMKLLQTSIKKDGYTQPIVAWPKDSAFEVVDGFHRNRVGKECEEINKRIHGHLPIAIINSESQDRGNRISATIRHNRARGKHSVTSMSDLVVELKNRNWKNERIARELGMDEDEILRLCQITGLADLFSDDDFSKSWDIEGSSPDDFDFEEINDENINPEDVAVRTVNTGDSRRVFHTYEKWECNKAGFYASNKEGMKKKECEEFYAQFLGDSERFRKALGGVIREWKNSCEHYLTNSAMNRIAWLGQAAVCYESGIPACFCGGFNLLSESQQLVANNNALDFLNAWLIDHSFQAVSLSDAMTTRQSTIY